MSRFFLWPAALVNLALGAALAGSEPPGPRFTPASDGLFRFDTGVVRGELRGGRQNQGICSLIDVETGAELTHGVGALSYYRIFSSGVRYGDAARQWPTRCRLLPDGAVEIQFLPEEDYPFTLTAVYRWAARDTIDVETIVTAKRLQRQFEVFLSSYFSTQSRGFVYVRPGYFEQGQPRLMAADVNSLVDGTYLMFPRDRRAILTIFDGRWEKPPHPVEWSITRRIAGPLAVRRDERHDVAVAIMSPPEDCFAVSMPYNKTPPDGPAAHASVYLSLFGRDLPAGRTARARTRMVVGRGLSDAEILDRYQKYVADSAPSASKGQAAD